MSQSDAYQPESYRMRPLQENEKDLKIFIYLIYAKWHYFLISLILTTMVAFLYNILTIPTYKVWTTLLITEGRKGGIMDNNIGASAQNIDNQIMLLSSRTLLEKTIDELPFRIEYYYRGFKNKISIYPESPIKVIAETEDSLPRDIEFTLDYLNNNFFNLKARSKDSFSMNKQASFGELVDTPYGNFRIELCKDNWPTNKFYRKMQFIFHSREQLVESFSKRLKIDKVSKTGTILKLYLEGTNRLMDIEFLNKLTEIFLNNSLAKKNQEAIRTIDFIDAQLIGISDSLIITENRLQQFRSKNRIMDLSAQGKVIIDQAMNLENQKARLGIEANYYNYLADYLTKGNVDQAPIAPATIGITDPGLTKLVADLVDIQGQFYSKSLGEKNPLQSQLAQRLRNIKESLKETLDGVIRSNNIALSEINEQIRIVNVQASSLPITERQLLGIERKYKINDELYT